MKHIRLIITIGTVSIWHSLFCQVTTEPAFPAAGQEITIFYDATQGTSGLAGVDQVYMHSGVILDSPSGVAWTNVVGNWGQDDGIGEMTRVENESNLWMITLNPRDYFNVPEDPIYRIGMVFRNPNGSLEGKSDSNSDIFIDLLQGDYGVMLASPTSENFLVSQNESIEIEVLASAESEFTLKINEIEIETQTNISSYSYTHTVTESEGIVPVEIEATNGTNTEIVSFEYVVRANTQEVALPAAINKGINYHSDDNTKVTLCLEAPLKSSVYVLGDFNDWKIDPSYSMQKDGDFFWLEVTGLEPNQEYRFQYMVDETIFVADPYSDKISDPDDSQISSSTYPDLIEYPTEAYRDRWYYQRASVLETNRSPYSWEVDDFEKPEKDALVIYELLIRDYFGSGNRNYANLIDTLSYLDKLGVNAIQLMPITEFNGNESWGYNPSFMLAPDKYYGTREDLKRFIDEAHKLGIAVILDMVLNHQDIPGTNAVMYYDDGILPDNPWFNVTARHPFNVFFDFNHESLYTQDYLDSVNLYWIEEYKFDGYRYDLSKGFTQTNSGSDVAQWSSYDQSRIDLLERMADVIWARYPDTYIILEHFADNNEEKVLSDYGMMLWGNMNHSYNQLAMGYSSESNVSGVSASNRGWDDDHLVAYMESHDEERLMYRCLEFGNENATYSTKDFSTALERIKAVSSFFYTVPGPKMLWQFGELGFDYSINRCTDGSINENCRLSIKPTRWEYLAEEENARLFEVTSELIKLKTTFELFQSGEVSFFNGSNLSRYMWVVQNDLESPTDPSEMNAVIIGNFDIATKELDVNFPHDGKWYHYFDLGDSLEVVGTQTLNLQPGEFRLYTDVRLEATAPELYTSLKPIAPTQLTAEDLENGVRLSWVNDSEISTGIRVYRSAQSSGYVLVAELNQEDEYLDETVVPGGTYDYYVAAFNAIGERSSDVVSVEATNIVLSYQNTLKTRVFPNPATTDVNIKSDQAIDKIVIRDLTGKTIDRQSFRENINLDYIKEGIYLIELWKGGDLVETIKLIKE